MIHSLSGGIVTDSALYTFVKVRLAEGGDEGKAYWFLSETRDVSEGDAVLVPCGRGEIPCKGSVERVERCERQTAPWPMNRIKTLLCVLR